MPRAWGGGAVFSWRRKAWVRYLLWQPLRQTAPAREGVSVRPRAMSGQSVAWTEECQGASKQAAVWAEGKRMLPARRPCPCPHARGRMSGGGSSLSHNAESEVPDHGPLLHSTLSLLGARGRLGGVRIVQKGSS